MSLPPSSLEGRPPTAGRRLFLRLLTGAAAAAALAPQRALAGSEERILSFVHTHTHEQVTVPYFAGGAYVPGALSTLNRFLRDHRNGEGHEMDPALFDLLNDLRLVTRARKPFQVISGYRSPGTNSMLRTTGGGGVARGSLHMQGRAIDIRLADVDTAALRDAALELRRGGVGYYRSSDFVHVDTGRVRRW